MERNKGKKKEEKQRKEENRQNWKVISRVFRMSASIKEQKGGSVMRGKWAS